MQSFKLKLLFISIFIIIFGLVFYGANQYKDAEISDVLDKAAKELQLNFDIIDFHNSQDAQAIANFIQGNKGVISLFSQAVDANETKRAEIRNMLYKKISVQFNAMQEKGVVVLLFAFADNTVFLRVHKPDKYGDNIENIRYSIESTNKTHKPQIGFERGKITRAFRNVFPIYDADNRYIGCVDVSYSSESIQKIISNVHKIHTHFLVRKDVFDSKIWNNIGFKAKYYPSIENQDYSGHSLRSGFATVSAEAGADERSIMAMTGHKTTQMVRRYIKEANLFKNNALNKIKI